MQDRHYNTDPAKVFLEIFGNMNPSLYQEAYAEAIETLPPRAELFEKLDKTVELLVSRHPLYARKVVDDVMTRSERAAFSNVFGDFGYITPRTMADLGYYGGSPFIVKERSGLGGPLLEEEPCPNCGRPMRVKRGRFGNFLSCSAFPACKYAKPLSESSRALMEKRSRINKGSGRVIVRGLRRR